MTKSLNSLGSRLHEIRQSLRMSQSAFAELGGVKRLTQHLYENDVRVPDYHYFARLRAQGIDVDYLQWGAKANDLHDLALRTYRTVCDIAHSQPSTPEQEALFSRILKGFASASPKSGAA